MPKGVIKFSEEWKNNLKKNHKGMTGRKQTEITKEKIRKSITGKKRLDMRGDKNCCWNNGSSFVFYRKNSAEFKEKRLVVFQRDICCKVCGKNGEVVHHIDYNRRNNEIENLILVCRSCHSKTNFNRKFWEKKFK